jgi:hypothetical protein
MHTGKHRNLPAITRRTKTVSVLRAILAQANTPRRPGSPYDDSDVSSSAYPCPTVLGGIRRWSRRDRLSFPLHGLMVSRYRGEGAFTSASEGQESHLYIKQVIKDTACVFVFHP